MTRRDNEQAGGEDPHAAIITSLGAALARGRALHRQVHQPPVFAQAGARLVTPNGLGRVHRGYRRRHDRCTLLGASAPAGCPRELLWLLIRISNFYRTSNSGPCTAA